MIEILTTGATLMEHYLRTHLQLLEVLFFCTTLPTIAWDILLMKRTLESHVVELLVCVENTTYEDQVIIAYFIHSQE